MGNKLDRYWITFWLAVDADSKYIVNGFPDLGKKMTSRQLDSASVTAVWCWSWWNLILTDEGMWPLQLNWQISCCVRERPWSWNTMTRRLLCKQMKTISVLSTLHLSVGTSTRRKKTPESLTFYNSTKVGVNVLDRHAHVPCEWWLPAVANGRLLQRPGLGSHQCLCALQRVHVGHYAIYPERVHPEPSISASGKLCDAKRNY